MSEKHLEVLPVAKEAEPRARPADVSELLQSAETDGDPIRGFSRCLFVLFKQATLYDLKNVALAPPLERTVKQAAGFLERDGVLAAQRRVDGLYVNNGLVPRDPGLEELYPFLESVFEKLGVHELVLLPGVTQDALKPMLAHYQKILRGEGEVSDYRWEKVHLRSLPDEKARTARRERERVVAAYATVCVRAGEALNGLAHGKVPQLPPLQRALQSVLDLPREHEGVLIACLPLTREKGAPWGHAANCAVLTGLMLGKLGASRRRMLSSAMAAALHDLGTALPEDAPGGGEPWRRALALLLQIPRQGAELAGRVAALRECGVGTPAVPERLALCKLVALAHAFDLLISGSPSRPPLTPEQTVRVLSAEAGRRHDAGAFALLCKSVGLVPPGSLVQLSTGELAVPIAVPEDPRLWMTPVVRLVDASGKRGPDVDLASPQAGGRKVARTVLPREAGVNPLAVLL